MPFVSYQAKVQDRAENSRAFNFPVELSTEEFVLLKAVAVSNDDRNKAVPVITMVME